MSRCAACGVDGQKITVETVRDAAVREIRMEMERRAGAAIAWRAIAKAFTQIQRVNPTVETARVLEAMRVAALDNAVDLEEIIAKASDRVAHLTGTDVNA